MLKTVAILCIVYLGVTANARTGDDAEPLPLTGGEVQQIRSDKWIHCSKLVLSLTVGDKQRAFDDCMAKRDTSAPQNQTADATDAAQ